MIQLQSFQPTPIFDLSTILGLIAGFLLIIVVVLIALYVYMAFALMTIAKKTKTNNAWLAWIPIANIFLMANIAKVHWGFALGMLLVNLVPFVGGFISLAIAIYMLWKIAEIRGFPGWTSLLFIIPVVNLIMIGVYAWGK
ncbi:MAG: hypothetical protein AABX51_04805 [Nanoarchaeota archaeon]